MKQAKTTLKANIRFSFDLCDQCKTHTPIVWRGPEWDNFSDAIKIRDRLMHPKLQGDMESPLDVSSAELIIIHKARNWFSSLLAKTFEELKAEVMIDRLSRPIFDDVSVEEFIMLAMEGSLKNHREKSPTIRKIIADGLSEAQVRKVRDEIHLPPTN